MVVPVASTSSKDSPAVIESSLDDSAVRSNTVPLTGLLVCLEAGDVDF